MTITAKATTALTITAVATVINPANKKAAVIDRRFFLCYNAESLKKIGETL